MPGPATTAIAALPVELVCRVLDALELEDRLVARLVCREWARLPLRHGRAGRFPTVTALLKRLARKLPKTWARTYHARFEDVRTLEIASGGSEVPRQLHAALVAPACATLETLCIGGVYRTNAQELLAAVATGAPRLRSLCFGAPSFHGRQDMATGKMWVSGNLVLRHSDGGGHGIPEGAFAALETLEARGESFMSPLKHSLVIDMPLPGLRTLRLAEAKAIVVGPGHLSPELRIECAADDIADFALVILMTCACPWESCVGSAFDANACQHEQIDLDVGTFGDMLRDGVTRGLLPPSVLA